jgi:hypothetical protein
MDQKLMKGINHVLNDLKTMKEEAEECSKGSECKEFFEGEAEGLSKSIDLIERILSDYDKRIEKQKKG